MIRILRNKVRHAISRSFLSLLFISFAVALYMYSNYSGWISFSLSSQNGHNHHHQHDHRHDNLLEYIASYTHNISRRKSREQSGTSNKARTTLSAMLLHHIITASSDDTFVDSWRMTANEQCGGRFVGYANELAVLRDVVVDRRFVEAYRAGGEPLSAVMNQTEDVEYVSIEPGFFQLDGCSSPPKYFFNNEQNVLNNYLQAIVVDKDEVDDRLLRLNRAKREQQFETEDLRQNESAEQRPKSDINFIKYDKERGIYVVEKTVLLVIRYEYVNLYHTMTDWYNAFFSLAMLEIDQSDVQVLFLDAHPSGSLDSTWVALFSNVFRLHDLPADRVHFRRLVFVTWGYNSPMSISSGYVKVIPILDTFRLFMLASLKLVHFDQPLADALVSASRVKSADQAEPLDRFRLTDLVDRGLDIGKPNCSNLHLTMIFRRPYIAHPRNPSGKLSRQIANEREIVSFLKERYLESGAGADSDLGAHTDWNQQPVSTTSMTTNRSTSTTTPTTTTTTAAKTTKSGRTKSRHKRSTPRRVIPTSRSTARPTKATKSTMQSTSARSNRRTTLSRPISRRSKDRISRTTIRHVLTTRSTAKLNKSKSVSRNRIRRGANRLVGAVGAGDMRGDINGGFPGDSLDQSMVEDGDLEQIQYASPAFSVKFADINPVQLEHLSFREQLALIRRTSVLIGMHGAALTHALFVPRFASVIELSPAYIGTQDHFLKLCESRRVHYSRWMNVNYRYEVAESLTYVPTNELRRLVDGSLINLGCAPAPDQYDMEA